MWREIWRVVPLLTAAVFVGAALTTVGLLVRAEWTRGADGRRRPQRSHSRHQLWPDPARIPLAGRPLERRARWTALVALLALGLTGLAMASQ